MTDWLLGLVPQYGVWLLAACTFLSCFAIPLPSSMLMLAAGGFVAAGDLALTTTVGATLAGVFAGDQSVYYFGKHRGDNIKARLGKKAALLEKATSMLNKRGGIAVFLSRWLLSALGPYMNFAAGMAKLPWLQFTLWGLAGELIWIGLYLGSGYYFTGNLEAASTMALKVVGLLAAGAVAIAIGYWIFSKRSDEGPT
jgi:membrane-associated protein